LDKSGLCILKNSVCKSSTLCSHDEILQTNKEINNRKLNEFEYENDGFFKRTYYKLKNFFNIKKLFSNDLNESFSTSMGRFFFFFILFAILFILFLFLCARTYVFYVQLKRFKHCVERNLSKDKDSDYESEYSQSCYSDDDSDIFIELQ